MYKCRRCGEVFEEDEIRESVTYHPWRDGEADEVFEECPYCGDGDFDEAEQCEECGEWFLRDELHDGRCDECLKKNATFDIVLPYAEENDDVKGLVESVLSTTEINNLLVSAAREKLKLLSSLREKVAEYAMEDKDCFGYYIANRIAEGR